MMSPKLTLAAAAAVAIGMLPLGAWAQSNPSANQIIRSLTPTGHLGTTTRGIRLANQPPAMAHAPSVSLNVDFATGSAMLTPQARQELDQLGEALTAQQLASYRFRVEGHTDTVGSRALNQALSVRRADRVVHYLETRFHIDPSRLAGVGMGENGLLVPTPDNTPEPRNRRVRVVNIGG